MLRHPDTATNLSPVKSNESDCGTAAQLIKRQPDGRRLKKSVSSLVGLPVSQSIEFALIYRLGTTV